jgi:hypothetical protein
MPLFNDGVYDPRNPPLPFATWQLCFRAQLRRIYPCGLLLLLGDEAKFFHVFFRGLRWAAF